MVVTLLGDSGSGRSAKASRPGHPDDLTVRLGIGTLDDTLVTCLLHAAAPIAEPTDAGVVRLAAELDAAQRARLQRWGHPHALRSWCFQLPLTDLMRGAAKRRAQCAEANLLASMNPSLRPRSCSPPPGYQGCPDTSLSMKLAFVLERYGWRAGPMTLLLMSLTLLMALAVRCARTHQELSQFELLRASRSHGMRVELRRRALISRMADDLQEYPQPRELRVVVWRLAGLVLWCEKRLAALPQHYDVLVHQLRATDTDHLFGGGHRLAGAPELASVDCAAVQRHA